MLTSKQKQYALLAREFIKVKINQNSDEDIKETASYIADKLQCDVVQVIGRTCVLFKQKEKKSHYELP